jgi:hypothetical protein
MEEEELLKVDSELEKELWKVPVPIGLINDTSLSNGAFRLYLCLMGYARQHTTCFPSRAKLAENMGVEIKTIDRLKKQLKAAHLLDWEKSLGTNGWKKNTYMLLSYKPIQAKINPLSEVKNVPREGKILSSERGQECISNNTNIKNTKIKNTTTKSVVVETEGTERASETDGSIRESILELWKKLEYPEVRKIEMEKLKTLPETKLAKFYGSLPLLEYYHDDWWDKSNKNLAVALHRLDALIKFRKEFISNPSTWFQFSKQLMQNGYRLSSIAKEKVEGLDDDSKQYKEVIMSDWLKQYFDK